MKGSYDGIGVVAVGEAELGVGLHGRDEDGVFVGGYVEGVVPGGGGGGGTESLFLKSMMASFLSSSAAQQLKKGFFFYTVVLIAI